MNTTKKLLLGVVALGLVVGTAIVSFLIGAGLTARYGARYIEPALPTFRGATLQDDLTSNGFGAVGPQLMCAIKSKQGSPPDRVLLEYVDEKSNKQVGSQIVDLATNEHGAKYFQITVPRFENLVIVNVKREP